VLERVWRHKGRLILKFQGVDSISDGQRLRGWKVRIPREELGEPAKGEYYFADLEGCSVIDSESGRLIGIVTDLLESAGLPLLRVDSRGREVLIPFNAAICAEVRIEKKEIRVKLPEGLEELNQ